MGSDSVFITANPRVLRDVAESSPEVCIVGDCAQVGRLKLKEGVKLYDFEPKEKHSPMCLGSLDGGKMRRFELLVIGKTRECPVLLLANMENLYRGRKGEVIRMVHAISRKKSPGCRLYLSVTPEMLRELEFFCDKVLK